MIKKPILEKVVIQPKSESSESTQVSEISSLFSISDLIGINVEVRNIIFSHL